MLCCALRIWVPQIPNTLEVNECLRWCMDSLNACLWFWRIFRNLHHTCFWSQGHGNVKNISFDCLFLLLFFFLENICQGQGGGEGISSKLQSASTTSDDYAYFVEDTTRHKCSHIEVLPLFITMVQCNSHVMAIFTICSHVWWWDSRDIGKPPREFPLSAEVITVLLYNAWDESMRWEAPIPFWLVAYQNT